MLNVLGLSDFSGDEFDKEEIKKEVKEEVKEEVKGEIKEEESESDGDDPNVIYKKWRQIQEGTKLDR